MSGEVKRLPDNVKTFEANGRKYVVHTGLTVSAFQKLEELRLELEAGNSVPDMVKMMQQAYGKMNEGKMADAAVIMYNAINVTERIIEGRPPLWLLELTLFVRPEGSDVTKWDEGEAMGWIQDWENEGYDTSDFFALATRLHSAYVQLFTASIMDSLPSGSEGTSET